MTDILHFTDGGKTYAKGFFNQNGASFYVLPGFMDKFLDKVGVLGVDPLAEESDFFIEEISELPGPDRCPPEVP